MNTSLWAPKETAVIEEMCLSVSRGEFVMVHCGRSPEVAGEALSVSWWEVAAPRHRLEVWMEGKPKYSTAPLHIPRLPLPFLLLMPLPHLFPPPLLQTIAPYHDGTKISKSCPSRD